MMPLWLRRARESDVRPFAWLDGALQDARYGARVLRRTPWFTAVAVLSLTAGIGSAAAVFNVADAVLFRPLAVDAPHDLAAFHATLSYGAGEKRIPGVPDPLFLEMQRAADFADLIAFRSIENVGFTSAPGAAPRTLAADAVSDGYFRVLGVAPAHGRLLDAADAGNTPIPVVLSERLWRAAFHADTSLVGRTVGVNGRPAVVVGVARTFRGMMAERPADVFAPMSAAALIDPSSATRVARLVVRRKPSISSAIAEQRLAALYLAGSIGTMIRGSELRIRLVDASRGVSDARVSLERPLAIGLALTGLLLIVACANTAGLLVARFAARQGEFGIRMAIGAGRSRLIRQLAIEALLLGALGAAAGLAVAAIAGPLLVRAIPAGAAPLDFDLRLDWRLVAFTSAISIAAASIAACGSLGRVLQGHPAAILGSSSRGIVRGRRYLTEVLIAAQVACSLLLLSGAGALARTLINLHDVAPGFDARNALAVTVDVSGRGTNPAAFSGYFTRLHDALATTPHVARVSLAQVGLMSGAATTGTVEIAGFTPHTDDDRWTRLFFVGAGYFETSGMPVLIGRGITRDDTPRSERVAVVNEQFARFYFGAAPDALGRTINGNIRIVGVVADAHYDTLRDTPARAMFVPHGQGPPRAAMTFIVRAAGDPAVAHASTIAAIRSFDPLLRPRVTPLAEQVASTLARERFVALLATTLSILAVFLACAGLYGAVAFAVSERRTEFAVRLAVGAGRGEIRRLVLRDPLRTTIAGIAIGVPGVFVVMRGLSALLYGVTRFDPTVVACASGLLVVVATLAAVWPAYRAGRIDPVESLRCG
jgi:putative ABC transport system permease protein